LIAGVESYQRYLSGNNEYQAYITLIRNNRHLFEDDSRLAVEKIGFDKYAHVWAPEIPIRWVVDSKLPITDPILPLSADGKRSTQGANYDSELFEYLYLFGNTPNDLSTELNKIESGDYNAYYMRFLFSLTDYWHKQTHGLGLRIADIVKLQPQIVNSYSKWIANESSHIGVRYLILRARKRGRALVDDPRYQLIDSADSKDGKSIILLKYE
jgi:hypothetical protein